MKKTLVLSMALILCVMSVFVGCSSTGGENKELAAFAEKQQAAVDSAGMTGFTIKCSARGDALAYTYEYDTDLLTKELAQSTLDMLDSTYSVMLAAVQKEVPSCKSVIIEIVDKDGKVLAETEYN